jgi:hypothetical protein
MVTPSRPSENEFATYADFINMPAFIGACFREDHADLAQGRRQATRSSGKVDAALFDTTTKPLDPVGHGFAVLKHREINYDQMR